MTQQIDAAKAGSQIAFTYLWNFYWNDVYLFILNRTRYETFAKEITNETFARAFVGINTYKSEFNFNTWLISIAKNVHYDLLNRKLPIFIEISDKDSYVADNSPSPEDELINSENHLRLLKSINRLRPHYQKVFMLRHEGYNYKEIVQVTGCSHSSVRTILSRAKAELVNHYKT